MRNYKFKLEGDIGGFVWWGILKLGKTKLDDEIKDENAPRNILTFYLLLGLLIFISVKLF